MATDRVRTASWIETTPGVCSGAACIRRTRHTVAGLVQWRRLGLDDAEILERHPDLSSQDLEAAWRYDESHAEEIERAIRLAEEA